MIEDSFHQQSTLLNAGFECKVDHYNLEGQEIPTMPSPKTAVARIASTSRFFSSSSSKSKERWARRCRLLDASRGVLNDGAGEISSDSRVSSSAKKRPLPVFPLEAHHFGGYDKLGSEEKSLPPNTPKEFHQSLCEMIRNAKERVRIASLYVGPATSNREACEEAELLEALSELVERNYSSTVEKKVSVKIILDANRALRPVPTASTPPPSSSTENQISSSGENSKDATSSAEAVARAIRRGTPDDGDSSSSLHLFRVLPPTKIGEKSWLPNPLDEIAGVFHIKIYIVDDQLLLTGANLSREYFTDRMDRYLHLIDGANGLVDFYADLVDILCRHSNEYDPAVVENGDNGSKSSEAQVLEQRTQRAEFLREITRHFQDPNGEASSIPSAQDLFDQGDHNDDTANGDKRIVALGVPTFQAPAGYFRHKDIACAKPSPVAIATDVAKAFSTFMSLFLIHRQPADDVDLVTDVDATLNLLREAGKANGSNGNTNWQYSAHLSSAYLNPTKSLLSVLQEAFTKVELLTAGKISHGFKPKKKECKEGSQGKDWTIPSVFDKLVDECMSSLRSKNDMDARLFFWERPNWTFHAKGIWLKDEMGETNDGSDNSEVAAVVVGSSNFGYRSFYRDMESNLLLVFPPGSSNSIQGYGTNSNIASSFGEEWNNLIASSKREALENDNSDAIKDNGEAVDAPEKAPPLPWPILKSIPLIKTFF